MLPFTATCCVVSSCALEMSALTTGKYRKKNPPSSTILCVCEREKEKSETGKKIQRSFTNTLSHLLTHIYTSSHVHICMCVHVFASVCVCICIYIYMCVCSSACMWDVYRYAKVHCDYSHQS